jgi:hypothetical protein
MKKKKLYKNKKGITLIALVITIIVLFILSGVSLNIMSGSDGLIGRAKRVKKAAQNAEDDETRKIAIASALSHTVNTEFIDENGDKAIIPAGFTRTGVKGENTVRDGLVITDAEQNEFVWIPVKSEEEYKQKFGKNAYMTVDGKSGNKLEDMIAGDVLGVNEILGQPVNSELSNQPEKEVVVNAGGFWVGRYEAGTTDTGSDGSSNVTKINCGTAEIKSAKGIQPARDIKQTQALSRANTWLSNEYVQSGLITGTRMGCDV